MSRSRRFPGFGARLAFVLGTCVLGRRAWADPPLAVARTAGAESCPGTTALQSALEADLHRPLADVLGSRTIEVVFEHSAGTWRAGLAWRNPDESAFSTRTFEDASNTCDGVVRALEISTLLALGVTPGSPPPLPPPPASSPTATPPPTATATASPPAPPPAPPTATPSPPTTRVRPGAIVLGGIFSVGWLPPVAYGAELWAEPLVYGKFRLSVWAVLLAEMYNQITGVNPLTYGIGASEMGVSGCWNPWSNRIFEPVLCGGFGAGGTWSIFYSGSSTVGGTQGTFGVRFDAVLRFRPYREMVLDVPLGAHFTPTPYRLNFPDGSRTYLQSSSAFTTGLRLGVAIP